jgi:hypothetical protein
VARHKGLNLCQIPIKVILYIEGRTARDIQYLQCSIKYEGERFFYENNALYDHGDTYYSIVSENTKLVVCPYTQFGA